MKLEYWPIFLRQHFNPIRSQGRTSSKVIAVKTVPAIVLLVCLVNVASSFADTVTFGGDQQFSLEFVEISDPGNPDDPRVQTADIPDAPSTFPEPNPSGGVDYEYGISKFEISLAQFSVVNELIGRRQQFRSSRAHTCRGCRADRPLQTG